MRREREEDVDVVPSEGPINRLPSELLVHIMQLAPNRGLFAVSHKWAQCARTAELPWWDLLLNDQDRYLFGSYLTHNANVTWEPEDRDAVHMKLYDMMQKGNLPRKFLDEGALLFSSLIQAIDRYGTIKAQCHVNLFNIYLDNCQSLSIRNFHPRDMRVTFRETPDEPHRYKVLHWNGQNYEVLSNDPESPKALCSVTTYHDTIFKPFDRAAAIKMVMGSYRYRKDPAYRYYGLTEQQIGEAWDRGSQDGSDNHQNLEDFINGKEHDANRIEFKHFLSFTAAHITGAWQPFRSEQILYSVPLRMVGAVDMLYEPVDPAQRFDEQGRRRLFMVDWKFCHRIEHEGFKGAMGSVKATDDVPDCNVGHYRVQLHWYMVLLERYYGCVIVRMALVFLHHEQQDYIIVEVPRDDRMIRRIVAHRMSELCKRRATEAAEQQRRIEEK